MQPIATTPDASDECFSNSSQRQRWLSPSMVLRLAALTAFVIPIAVTVAVGGKNQHEETVGSGSRLRGRALLSIARDLGLPRLNTRATSTEGNATNGFVDTEVTNITIILEHMDLGPQEGPQSPWMFSSGDEPFVEESSNSSAYFANSKFSWNANGTGNHTCESGGSGEVSRGYVDPFHNYLDLSSPLDYTQTEASLAGLELHEFAHINTETRSEAWNVKGKAGDTRRYKNGIFELREAGEPLFRAVDVQWIQNLSYPAPAGASKAGVFEMSAYFVGKIDFIASKNEWIARLDPVGVGYVLGIVTGGSFGASSCYTANSYWITLRGFPELNEANSQIAMAGGPGARDPQFSESKQGIYPGSSPGAIAMGKTLASMAGTAVTAVTVAAVGSSIAGAGMAATGGGGPGPPGNGVSGLLKAAAFTAKVSQVPGFHTDTMKAFGSGLDPFLLRFKSPFGGNDASSGEIRQLATLSSALRQATGDNDDDDENGPPGPTTITEDLFEGTAFYSTLVILGFAVLHCIIWLVTRKKPLPTQVQCHAWMIYLFSIAMSYLYTASVLSSMQYFRSNIPYGTGKLGIYIVAATQLLLIGLGFMVFFFVIMALTFKRLRLQQVLWVPRDLLADPEMRRSATIAGEYEAEENAWFHELFQCYYNAMSGPLVWLAALELSIVFIDAVLSALIWNEKVCLGLLVSIYTILLCVFVGMMPHRDKIQGGLVCLLVFAELLCFILEFAGAMGDYATAEKCESIGVIVGFVVIALAVVIALYCDVIPTLDVLFKSLARRYRIRKYGFDPKEEQKELERGDSESRSDWSALHTDSEDSSQSERGRDASMEQAEFCMDSEALVTYNANRERETQQTMQEVFARRRTEELRRESSEHDSAF